MNEEVTHNADDVAVITIPVQVLKQFIAQSTLEENIAVTKLLNMAKARHNDGCQHVWGFDGAKVKCGLCGKVREDLEATLNDGVELVDAADPERGVLAFLKAQQDEHNDGSVSDG